MIDYDGDQIPKVTAELAMKALDIGCHLVRIVCDDKPGEEACTIGFLAITPSIPKKGEQIILEDKTHVQVINVVHVVSSQRKNDKIESIMLFPHVHARVVLPPGDE